MAPLRRVWTDREWNAEYAAYVKKHGTSFGMGVINLGQRIMDRKLAEYEQNPTVATLLAAYDCKPSCLCATTHADDCNCNCLGEFHGILANVPIER